MALKDVIKNLDTKEENTNNEEVKNELAVLPERALTLLEELRASEIAYKELDLKRKDMKEELQALMEQYGVVKWENELMAINYVAPSTRNSVDSSKLKKNYPDVYKDVIKTSNVKASIRFVVK